MSLQSAVSEIISLTSGSSCADLILRKCQEISDAIGDELKNPVEITVAPAEVIEVMPSEPSVEPTPDA